MLNEEGRSLSVVQEALGHADIRSTNHYAEMLPGRRAELLGNRSQVTQNSHNANRLKSQEKMAGGRGVEPRFTESESVVLPLNDPPLIFRLGVGVIPESPLLQVQNSKL